MVGISPACGVAVLGGGSGLPSRGQAGGGDLRCVGDRGGHLDEGYVILIGQVIVVLKGYNVQHCLKWVVLKPSNGGVMFVYTN